MKNDFKLKLNLFDNFRKLEISHKHQNIFIKTLSALIPIFHHTDQWVKQNGSRLLFGKVECMLDFTKVQINVHEFNPCFLILHNHDETYSRPSITPLFRVMDFTHVRKPKID